MAFNTGGLGGDDAPMAEINIIPLVDVMLVLLIITMITSPFMETGVDIDLPVTQESRGLRKSSGSEAPLTLFISKDQNIRLGEQPVSRDLLVTKLETLLKERQDKQLFVRADREVPYGIVAAIMAKVQGAGIDRVSLVTQDQVE